MALAVLLKPGVHGVHLPWARWAKARLPKVDPLLLALMRRDDAKPGFLMPPPDSRLPDIDAELAVMRATPSNVVSEQAARYTTRRPDIARIAGQLRELYEVLIAPHWERMSRVLDADIAYRAGILATGGMERLFADLHSDVIWRNGELIIHPHTPRDQLVELRGQGIVLCPSVFCWPRVGATVRPSPYGTLRYPARAVATLWETPTPAPDALASLIGRTRAALLTELSTPATTSSLANRLSVTPGAISQHLAVLRDAGLVATTRDGRTAVHLRTPAAEGLCT